MTLFGPECPYAAHARTLDADDPLASFRKEFAFPRQNQAFGGYFAGNSLGLMPLKTKDALEEVLHDWGDLAVEAVSYTHLTLPTTPYV